MTIITNDAILQVLRKKRGHIFTAHQICDKLDMPRTQARIHTIRARCHEMASGGRLVVHWESVGFKQRTVKYSTPEQSRFVEFRDRIQGVYNTFVRHLARLYIWRP